MVCLAAGIQDVYKYYEDSNRFEGTHIIPVTQCEMVSQS